MKIGSFDLDSGKTFIIAELSANHNGSLERAKESIQEIALSGADAVKLQTYRADTITLDSDKEDFVIRGGTLWDERKLYELYEEAYTPWEWHEELFEYARSLGLECFSSPFDKSAVDFLEQFNPPAYKIASFEITDYELIRYAASKKRPMIISTGIAKIEEIEDVINICKAEGNHDIVILKCTSSYPAPLDRANLATIVDMRGKFEVEVGFSDHTLGVTAPIVAVTLGAKVIEKHFIIDKSMGGVDSEFSLDKAEFGDMVRAVREAEELIGGVDYSFSENSRSFARSLYVSAPIKKGEIFTESNIKSVRPGYSLHPKYLHEILGKVASKDYELGDRIEESLAL